MYRLQNIKEGIYNLVYITFLHGTPSYSQDAIRKAIDLFIDFLNTKSGNENLHGLSVAIFSALQELLVDKIYSINNLDILATKLEPFCRKVLMLKDGKTYEELSHINLAPLLKQLHLNTSLSTQARATDYPILNEANLESFKSCQEYLYSIAIAYVKRNDIHNAALLDFAEIAVLLKHILVVYLYVVLVHKNIVAREIQANGGVAIDDETNLKQKLLFDFFNYGDTSTELKKQIVNAYIENYLYQHPQSSISTLVEDSTGFFKNAFTKDFFERQIDRLRGKGQIVPQSSEPISLSNDFKNKITQIHRDYLDNQQNFYLIFDELLSKYHIEDKRNNLLNRLSVFFEQNFNIDLVEAYCLEDDMLNNQYSDILDFLKSIVGEELYVNLFKDILECCEDNDFLLRESASKVFCNLSNPDKFENYLRQQNMSVYLDTQIVLYALCDTGLRNDGSEDVRMRVIKKLIEYARKNPKIKLYFSTHYFREVTNQIKIALGLIPFVDDPSLHNVNVSSNVFYKYYIYLRDNSLLEENINSFADFLYETYNLSEDDLIDNDFEGIARDCLSDFMEQDLGISVINIPTYETTNAEALLQDVILKNRLPSKNSGICKNDAIMVSFLADTHYHEGKEPYFITLDRTFTPYRMAFKNKYSRREVLSWHLFSPAKFLNHVDLMSFKIEPQSFTDDMKSVIEDFGFVSKTRTIYESMVRLADVKGIGLEQRRNYVKKVKTFFSDSEFSYKIESTQDANKSIEGSLSDIVDKLNEYIHKFSKTKFNSYCHMIIVEEYFEKLLNIISGQIENLDVGISDNFTEKIDELIEKYTQSLMRK